MNGFFLSGRTCCMPKPAAPPPGFTLRPGKICAILASGTRIPRISRSPVPVHYSMQMLLRECGACPAKKVACPGLPVGRFRFSVPRSCPFWSPSAILIPFFRYGRSGRKNGQKIPKSCQKNRLQSIFVVSGFGIFHGGYTSKTGIRSRRRSSLNVWLCYM